MKPALAYRQPLYPKDWQEMPSGEQILEEINQIMAPWWPKFFGYHLLKIGGLSQDIATAQSTIRHQITVSDHQERANVVGDVDDLPLLQHSVDVAILSHVLEYAVDPHHVIREANRVLIPNGYLVITGFNPFSLAGLNKIVPYRRHKSPWNERFFTAMRVKDWLHLMGYEILHDERCLHSSLVGKLSYGVIARNWRKIATKLIPSFGSVYVIIAKKRVLPLTPIKPRWKLRPELAPINVSTLNSSRVETRAC
ncbi:class I SAM-dependent methyltransferase [Thalassotalea fusca]